MKNLYITIIIGLISVSSVYAAENTAKIATEKSAENGKHLFILSGQSNMDRFKADKFFTPGVEAKFGKDNVIVVKVAQSSEHIRKWDKEWSHPSVKYGGDGRIYDRLMKQVALAIKEKTIKTVTFIWMQGEADAAKSWGDVYEASLRRVMKNIKVYLGRTDLNFIIGRLSDWGMDNKWPHWTMIRDIQVKIAESSPRGAWVDTDDFNGKGNGLHHTKDGYKELGKSYVKKAIELIDKHKNKKKVIDKDKK